LIDLRHQKATADASLLSHKSELRGFAAEYFDWKKRVKDGSITEEDTEEYDYFTTAKFNYEDCKNRIQTLIDSINSLDIEIIRLEKAMNEMKARMAEEADDDKSMYDQDMDEDNGDDSDELSMPSDFSRDGTSNIDDRLVPPFESIV